MQTTKKVLMFFGVSTYDPIGYKKLSNFINDGDKISKMLKEQILRIYSISSLIGDTSIDLNAIVIIDDQYPVLIKNYQDQITDLEKTPQKPNVAYKLFNNSYLAFATTDEMFDSLKTLYIEYSNNRESLKDDLNSHGHLKLLDRNHDFAFVQRKLYKKLRDFTYYPRLLDDLKDSKQILLDTLNMISLKQMESLPGIVQLYKLGVEYFNNQSNTKLHDILRDYLVYNFISTSNHFELEKQIFKFQVKEELRKLRQPIRNESVKVAAWKKFLDRIDEVSSSSSQEL